MKKLVLIFLVFFAISTLIQSVFSVELTSDKIGWNALFVFFCSMVLWWLDRSNSQVKDKELCDVIILEEGQSLSDLKIKLSGIENMDLSREEAGVLEYHTAGDFYSFGECIRLQLFHQEGVAHKLVKISSRSRVRWTLLDYGTNNNNVKAISDLLLAKNL